MSPVFQSIHKDGARNKGQELKLLKNLNLRYYTLGDFSVTENAKLELEKAGITIPFPQRDVHFYKQDS